LGNSKEKKKKKETITDVSEDEDFSESASLTKIFKKSLPSNTDDDVYVFLASNGVTLLPHESGHETSNHSGCSHHPSPHHIIDKSSLHCPMDTSQKGVVPAIPIQKPFLKAPGSIPGKRRSNSVQSQHAPSTLTK